MTIDGWLLGAGVLAVVTWLIHTFYGGRALVKPFLAMKIDRDIKYTFYAVWHMATVVLLFTAAVLLYAGLGGAVSNDLVIAIAGLWLLFGGVFIGVNVIKLRKIFVLPQWIFLLVVGVLALISTQN